MTAGVEGIVERAIIQDKTVFLQMKKHPWLSITSFIVIVLLWELVSQK
jgi:hypothetical protein